jgi:SAM-dependent methyltransferase
VNSMACGPPILFENMLIRKMLELADIKKDDVFYDLGSGHGQNLIIAAKEYGVKDCIGVDYNYQRCKHARKVINKMGLDDQITIVNRPFEVVDLSNADVVFYGLSTDAPFVDKLRRNLKRGCRLVHYALWPIPRVKVEKIDYPFYLSRSPLKIARTEREWLSSLVPREMSVEEYWREVAPRQNTRFDVGFFRSRFPTQKAMLQRAFGHVPRR